VTALASLWRSSWGVLPLAAGHAAIGAVIIAVLLAVLVGAVLYALPPTRSFAGVAAVVVLVVLLLLLLV
jgi:amino acid permease